jgi:hypothetical protein
MWLVSLAMTHRSTTTLMTAVVLALAACGGGDDSPSSETTPVAPSPSSESTPVDASPSDVAYDYALEKSGGETLGCLTAARGAESETNPGCIFSVSFSGCLEGLTGEQSLPLPVEEEFDQEPALVELYRQAAEDCKAMDANP